MTDQPKPELTPFGYRVTDLLGTPLLPISRPTCSKWVKEGLLSVARVGGAYFVSEEELLALPDRLRAATEAKRKERQNR